MPPSKKKQLIISTQSQSQKKMVPGTSSIKKIPKFQPNLMNSKKSSEEGMKVLPKKPVDEFRSKSNISP